MPLLLRLVGIIRNVKYPLESTNRSAIVSDYAIIVTAYGQATQLPKVVESLLDLDYDRFVIYIVADNCDVSELHFAAENVRLLVPTQVLASNVKSHEYAISSFIRSHQRVVIIDSDNLVDPGFLTEVDRMFADGYEAVQ